MIKINVITNNIAWQSYIKNPNNFIEKTIKNFNIKDLSYKKKKLFCTLLLSGDSEIKKLILSISSQNLTDFGFMVWFIFLVMIIKKIKIFIKC